MEKTKKILNEYTNIHNYDMSKGLLLMPVAFTC